MVVVPTAPDVTRLSVLNAVKGGNVRVIKRALGSTDDIVVRVDAVLVSYSLNAGEKKVVSVPLPDEHQFMDLPAISRLDGNTSVFFSVVGKSVFDKEIYLLLENTDSQNAVSGQLLVVVKSLNFKRGSGILKSILSAMKVQNVTVDVDEKDFYEVNVLFGKLGGGETTEPAPVETSGIVS